MAEFAFSRQSLFVQLANVSRIKSLLACRDTCGLSPKPTLLIQISEFFAFFLWGWFSVFGEKVSDESPLFSLSP